MEEPEHSQPLPESVWCLVGNVVHEHAFGTADEVRRGSKQFAAGTKVYCLPPQWGDGYESLIAVGIERRSRSWITVVMRSRLVTNWRSARVYKPAVIRRLGNGMGEFKRQWDSQEQVEAWVGELVKPTPQHEPAPGREP